jgi:hypothetical protein
VRKRQEKQRRKETGVNSSTSMAEPNAAKNAATASLP